MKKVLLIIAALFLFTSSIQAQQWVTNMENAKELAAAQDKKIVAFFSGSDWCPPCKKLDARVFSTEEFKNYAAANYILLRVDFPKRKKNLLPEKLQNHNKELEIKYNKKRHLPTVIVFNKNEEILGRTGYEKVSPSEYIKILDSFKG